MIECTEVSGLACGIKRCGLLSAYKSYASRHLNIAKLDMRRINRWTHHGSTRYLWKEAEVEATIHYVVYEQGLPMAVFENKERSFLALF